MRIPIIVTNLLVALLAFPISMDTSMGLVILAVTLFLVGLSRKALLLRKKTLRFPLQRIMSAALDEQWAGLYHLSANLLRYYSLPLLALGVIWPAFLGVVLIVFMTPPLVEYVRHRPRLDLPRFTLLYWSEMLAYQVGVWWGCAKRRTLDPLLPRVSLGW
jgi:urea transporter